MIQIPTNTEFTIYTKDYFVDKEGNCFGNPPHTRVYSYGDLYIETNSAKYIFHRVYGAYDYCARILDLLRKWNGTGSISIQLETLNEVTPFCPEGGYEVISKS